MWPGHLVIHLDLAPEQRWQRAGATAGAVEDLCDLYVEDLGGPSVLDDLDVPLPDEIERELKGMSQVTGVPLSKLKLANLYYDAVKVVLACTAFAWDGPTGPLHARSLDWWTERTLLTRHTTVVDYVKGDSLVWRSVAWPGFVGCYSGVAPGRLSVSLNAVLSEDLPDGGMPVEIALRTVLQKGLSFAQAVAWLETVPLASDCLLLCCGPRRGQGVVIERTPSRAWTRPWKRGLTVANDFILREGAHKAGSMSETSCARFDAASSSLSHLAGPGSAMARLKAPPLEWGATLQQMVMDPRSGDVWVSAPGREVVHIG